MKFFRNVLTEDSDLCSAVVNSLVDAVIMVHDMADKARIVYANEAACQHFGTDIETLRGWTPAQWDPHHDPDADTALSLPGGQSRCYETEHMTATGQRIPVEVTLSRLEYPGREYLLSNSRDLRPRKRMEASAYRLEMRAHEMRLEQGDKAIYNNLLDGIFHFDVNTDGELVVAGYNRRAEVMIGIPETEAIGRLKQEILPSGSQPGASNPERSCIANAAAVGYRDFLTLPGGSRYIENTLIPLSDAQGRVHQVIAIVHDVTERMRRESQETVRTETFDLLSAGADLSQVLAKVIAFAEFSRSGLIGAILLPDDMNTFIEQCIGPSLPGHFLKAMQGIPILKAGCALGRAAHLKTPVPVENIKNEYPELMEGEWESNLGIVSCWAIPILDSTAGLLGVFVFFWNQEGQDQATMDQACQMARLVIERHRTEAHIRYQADYDSLTGLPNRTLLNERLSSMMHEGRQLILLYIDLDNFKEINDTLGHHLGDLIIKAMAQRLRSVVPQQDLVARMSGDEFIVVLTNIVEVEHFAEKVRTALTGDYEVGQGSVWASASIGIALFPDQAHDLDELLSHADQALFSAKAAGKNCLRFFDQTMLEKTQLRVRLASDLRTALKTGQMSVHYQPIVDLETGEVMKAEALLRWTHPELGLVSPAVFIPVAEETGTIHELGDWVFHEAARVAMQWNQNLGLKKGGLRRISVNRSPRQFFTREGCDEWIQYLHVNGIPGEALGVEITEGLLLDDRPEVIRQLAAFRREGIAISLDDFGTGYSALSYLKKFDIDYLKIDRSFVHDIVSISDSRAIVESVAGMADKLGIRVIAEGVEEQEQAAVLADVGCRLAQGYFYARPMPEEAFMAFVMPGDRTLDGVG